MGEKTSDDARTAQKEVRIRLVERLILRGYKDAGEIRQALANMNPPVRVTKRTIYRYKGIIARKNTEKIAKKEGLNKTVEEIAFEIKQTFEEVNAELWREFHKKQYVIAKCPHCEEEHRVKVPGAGTGKVQALKEVRETTKETLSLLQSLGLIHKEADKTSIIGPDGKPVDPGSLDTAALNQQFIAFLKAKYQSPTGIKAEIEDNTAEAETKKRPN